MIHYVLGFLFANEGRLVWLLKKARGPSHLIGRQTGIGGKVEPGETSLEAMNREGIEEIGVDAPWVRYGSMGSPGLWVCDLFYADGTDLNPRSIDPTEPGGYELVLPTERSATSRVGNIPALLALAALAREGRELIDVRLDFLPDRVSKKGQDRNSS